MVKRLLIFFLLGAICILSGHAQQIPSYSFEEWAPIPKYQKPKIDPPAIYTSSSITKTFMNSSKEGVKRVQGVEGSALRLETVVTNSNDTVIGYFIWGGEPHNDNLLFPGGFPFVEKEVKSLEVDLRFSIDSTSPGWVIVQFKKDGMAIGGNQPGSNFYVFPVMGTQSEYKHFSFPFLPALSEVPDTAIVAFVSNDVFKESHAAIAGNFLEADNIVLENASPNIPNGNLNEWEDSPNTEFPVSWKININELNIFDNFRSSEVYHGHSSLKLRTGKEFGGEGRKTIEKALLGSVKNTNGAEQIFPGMKLNGKPQSFGLYYKNTNTVLDTALVHIGIYGYNEFSELRELIGTAELKLINNLDWKFEYANINYFQPWVTPDSAAIQIAAGSEMNELTNSEILVDFIRFHYCEEKLEIKGPSELCLGVDEVEYSVPLWENSEYIWSVPEGAVVSTGESKSDLKVLFGEALGEIGLRQIFEDGCPDIVGKVEVKELTVASVTTGANDTICIGDIAYLKASLKGASTIEWSVEGDGTFSNMNSQETYYQPSDLDYMNGYLKFYAQTSGNGECQSDIDSMYIYFVSRPVLDAGESMVICETQTEIELSGTSDVEYNKWFSSSEGVFSYPYGLTTKYTLSKSDMIAGKVLLSLEADNGFCADVSVAEVLIESLPSVDASEPGLICSQETNYYLNGTAKNTLVQWISMGTGSFVSPDTLIPATYQFSDTDKETGIVSFILQSRNQLACPQVSDTTNVKFDICSGIEDALASRVNVAPNPVEDILYINFENQFPEEVKLINLQGQKVYNNSGLINAQLEINVNSYPNGIYFMVAKFGDLQLTKKVVVR